MRYLAICKSDKKTKLKKKLNIQNGLEFNKKVTITLFDRTLIHSVLIKKMNKSLKNLINLYLLYDDDDDESRVANLMPKVETLRSIFIGQYAYFFDENEIESYLDKLNKFENKLNKKTTRKSRSR